MTQPETIQPDVFELYKFAIEMADRLSARRATSNSFFLTANAGLVAAIALFNNASTSTAPAPSRPDPFSGYTVPAIGFVFAATWWVVLRGYRDLSNAKWDVISRLENGMRFQLYQDERKILAGEIPNGWRRRYREPGGVELVIPILFLLVYIALGVRVALS